MEVTKEEEMVIIEWRKLKQTATHGELRIHLQNGALHRFQQTKDRLVKERG